MFQVEMINGGDGMGMFDCTPSKTIKMTLLLSRRNVLHTNGQIFYYNLHIISFRYTIINNNK
jgi:hypothetical protein